MMSAAGGPVHGAGFGILVGSLRLAVLRTGALPRPLAIAGLISAAAGVLPPLYFVTERAVWLIPAGGQRNRRGHTRASLKLTLAVQLLGTEAEVPARRIQRRRT